MGVKTRIGTMALNREFGSIELPEDVTLYCPQCGSECADKGQCLIEFQPLNVSTGEPELTISVDCRTCGCFGKPPLTINKKAGR